MPALPSVPQAIRLDLHQQIGEDAAALNRLFFSYTNGPPTVAQLTSWSSTLATAWGTNIAAAMPAASSLTRITMTDLSSVLGAVYDETVSVPGTGGGTALPANVCMVFDFKIARRYRGGKPRSYLSGLPESILADPQTWVGSQLTAYTNAWQAFINAVISGVPSALSPSAHINVSYYFGFTVVTNPVTGRARNVPKLRTTPLSDVVIGIKGNPRVGSQRRRSLIRG
jgi:hypothetical protein